MLPWSHATTEELLGLGVDALTVGDRRGLTLLGEVLTRECGAQFAETVTSALDAGTPLDAFDFLPPPSAVPRATAAPAPPTPATASAQGAPRAERAPRAESATSESVRPRTAGPAADRTAPPGPAHHRTLSPGAPPPLPDAGYVTAIEVAAHFGVSVKAVYRWMATGRIRAERRPGGSYRIPADQFRA